MKQILVASDFSDNAANAMQYAMELARVLHREVCVIHAIHPTEGINNSTYNAIFIEDYYNNKREALKEWASQFTTQKLYLDIPVLTICNVGFLKTVITNYIKANQVEFLVMGVTGSTGISGIVGSNASMVVSKVKVPTLFVPKASQFSDLPMITLATDYETRLSAEDVNALNELVKAFKSAELQVLYVEEKTPVAHRNMHENRLKELIQSAQLKFNYITNSSALNGIMEFLETHQTDMLCLVKHHHNIVYRLFTRSTVNQVLNKSVKAVLILHE